MKKRALSMLLAVILLLLPLSALCEKSTAPYQYLHDPRLNADAMADIVENPSAVYGFSPSPESKRLGAYAEFDWTDPEKVKEYRQSRIEYHMGFITMYEMFLEKTLQGATLEETARAVSAERNRLRLASYEGDPEGLAAVKKSNLETYGNEEGPTADSLYEKYGSWQMVLQKSFSVNSGMDACCGLYDDYYELYVYMGLVEDDGLKSEAGSESFMELFQTMTGETEETKDK